MRVFLIPAAVLLLAACSNEAAPQKIVNSSAKAAFKIWGNCNMCKETIESSLETEGIHAANWNKDSKQMQVEYDSTQISLPQIYHRIAMVGYDTEAERGNDSAYAELPECCQYTRKP